MSEHNEKPQASFLAKVAAVSGTPTDKRNGRRVVAWSLAWAVGLTLASQTLNGNIFNLQGGSWASGVLALVPVVLFVGVLRAYLIFVRGTDELQRLIQLQALAVGFGAGVLLLLHWELFEFFGAPSMDPSDAVLVPIFGYMFGVLYGGWRYR